MIITLLRKPLEGSVAENALQHGCGAINIDATRVSTEARTYKGAGKTDKVYSEKGAGMLDGRGKEMVFSVEGRWPANFILTHLEGCSKSDTGWTCVEGCPVQELDQQSGISKSTGGRTVNISNTSTIYGGGKGLGQNLCPNEVKGDPGFGDEGGASRFFMQFKKENNG